MVIDIIKKIILWKYIKERIIIRNQKKCAAFCWDYISDLNLQDIVSGIIIKKEIPNKHIIWQYWDSGFDKDNLPDIIKLCLESVDKNCGSDCTVIRISEDNLSEFIQLPDFILNKRRQFSIAHFTDIIRCLLLYFYGGCWLDTTVYLTDKIDDTFWEYPLFMFHRDDNEQNKQYWKNSFMYYFNWDDRFKVKVLNSIIFAQKGSSELCRISNILLNIWKDNSSLPDYFIFQILYNELIKTEWRNSDIVSKNDCIPHHLQQYLNDPKYNLLTPDKILKFRF